jgi:CDP-diacylglycerol--glycerol-3-phosphate 3-phosphatidyltransferase
MISPHPEREPTLFEKYHVLTIPNGITLLRFLALPVLGGYLMAGEAGRIVSLVLFVILAFLDMVDGYVARHFDQVSEFGKLFDPFVDKLFHFMTATLLCLSLRLPVWIPLFILVKEALMIVGGVFLLRRYKLVVYAKWYGKVATFLFAVAFALTILVVQPGQQRLAGFFFLIPILLSFVSYVQYGRENLIPTLRGTKNGSSDT